MHILIPCHPFFSYHSPILSYRTHEGVLSSNLRPKS